jgi:alkaline phosphatase
MEEVKYPNSSKRNHVNSCRPSVIFRRIVQVFLVLSIGMILPASGFRESSAKSQILDSAGGQMDHASAVILFIGDGMGAEQRKAGQWLSVGQSGQLIMDQLPVQGWSQTASADNPVTDSAAGATAISTGVKTKNGYIGVDPAGDPLSTILEIAHARGWSTGLITTVQIAHATPASFAAHVPDRNDMTTIAAQLLEEGVEVLLGGGEDEFLRTDQTGHYPEPGERTDGRDLVSEASVAGYTYVYDDSGFQAVNAAGTNQLLGLFADEGMLRPYSPGLAAMTEKAIEILSADPEGFFLMVEGGQIDWAGHANEAALAMEDVLGLDDAVQVALDYRASHADTLVIVTADHETGGMSVGLTSTGAPGEDGPFQMPDDTDFYVNWTTTGHTAADVPVTATGPWSGSLQGTYANTHLFTAMRSALDWWVWLPLVLRQ